MRVQRALVIVGAALMVIGCGLALYYAIVVVPAEVAKIETNCSLGGHCALPTSLQPPVIVGEGTAVAGLAVFIAGLSLQFRTRSQSRVGAAP